MGHLYFFSERNDADLARRAAEFRVPTTVVDPDGDFEDLTPAPVPATPPRPAALDAAAERMIAAGLDIEWEHGVLTGEWLGLQVARATLDGDVVVFDVGVGRHDIEANRILYPDGPSDAFLDQAIASVRERRRAAAAAHPARDLAPERWLRSVVRQRPELAGLRELHSGPPPTAREDLLHRSVAPGWGRDAASIVIAVCTVGVDPNAVVDAADARLQAGGWPGVGVRVDSSSTDLVIVVPEGDDHPMTRRLAALLLCPARVATVPAGWREVAS